MTDSFAIRNSLFGLPHVRQSNFDIRHCPAPHDATGRFDFVLANPPFNVNAVDKERMRDMVGPGRRFPFGLPRTDNATATRASAKECKRLCEFTHGRSLACRNMDLIMHS